jgi:maltoporin
MKKIVLALVFLTSTLFSYETEFSSFGYLRLQSSFDEDKKHTCFKAPYAGTKYRLGNECETWMELGVAQDIKYENGIVIKNRVRPAFLGQNNEKIDFLRFDEAYSQVYNLFDNSTSLWIGRKHHKRHESHINDYFFFSMSGTGFGVDDLRVYDLDFSYAFMFEDVDPQNVDGDESTLFQSHDLRIKRDLNRGDLTLFLNYMNISAKTFNATQSISSNSGYAMGLVYKDKKILKELFGMDGENTTGIFYGQGSAKAAGLKAPFLQDSLIEDMVTKGVDLKDAKTARFINHNFFENDTLGFMSTLVYEYKDEDELYNTKQKWFSFGVRPYWFFHKNSRLALEAGYDHVKDLNTNTTYYLSKLTSALEFALDRGVWQRPTLRLYYTYANWSDSSVGLVAQDVYANKNNGYNTGIQIEYWW